MGDSKKIFIEIDFEEQGQLERILERIGSNVRFGDKKGGFSYENGSKCSFLCTDYNRRIDLNEYYKSNNSEQNAEHRTEEIDGVMYLVFQSKMNND